MAGQWQWPKRSEQNGPEGDAQGAMPPPERTPGGGRPPGAMGMPSFANVGPEGRGAGRTAPGGESRWATGDTNGGPGGQPHATPASWPAPTAGPVSGPAAAAEATPASAPVVLLAPEAEPPALDESLARGFVPPAMPFPERESQALGNAGSGSAARNFARTGGARGGPTPRLVEQASVAQATVDVNEEVKFRVHRRLIQELETSRLDRLPIAEAREAVETASRQILQQEAPGVFGLARDELILAIVDEVLGLGPIEPLLRDPSISEVMVNGPDIVYFERDGRLQRAPIRFRDNTHIMRIIERIISPIGRRVDEASPMVDARLADGSRVNVVIPPVSPRSPSITIRKFRADKMKMADLVAVGALSESSVQFLNACVYIQRNIIVSGGTGSGKTTMLNALSGAIPEHERIVTIEDPAELKLQQEHVITLEARPASLEGKNEVAQRDLVRNALRMRPDRIIIGEVRGGEAFDMLQAMNTGHEGSISTVHANSPRDALARIENMVLMAGMDLPMRAIREQVASAVHVIIQVSRFPDGSRRLTHISETTGMEGQMITMQDIFKFESDGVDPDGKVLGSLKSTGIRPTFDRMFELAGIQMPPDLYSPSVW